MIHTTPTYFNGDYVSIPTYFRRLFMNDQFFYSSVWQWWKKTTLYWCVPLAVASLLLLAAVLYQEFFLRETPDWALVVGTTLIPFIVMLPIVWIGSYYYSFPAVRKITRELEQFVAQYIPDATHVFPLSLTNYVLCRKGVEFEIGFTVIPAFDSKGRKRRSRPNFFVALYYAPQPGTETRWFDEDTCMRKELVDEWETYCKGKESCKHLVLEGDAMFALFDQKELNAPGQVTDTME